MAITEPRDLIQVLSQMEYWRQEAPAESRRAFKRFTIRGEASLAPADLANNYEYPRAVQLRDVSRGGVGFLVTEYLEVGSVWRLCIQKHERLVGSQVLVVRFCRLVQDGLYLVGGQFVIEPYLMIAMGVDEASMYDDIRDRPRTADSADIVAPESFDE